MQSSAQLDLVPVTRKLNIRLAAIFKARIEEVADVTHVGAEYSLFRCQERMNPDRRRTDSRSCACAPYPREASGRRHESSDPFAASDCAHRLGRTGGDTGDAPSPSASVARASEVEALLAMACRFITPDQQPQRNSYDANENSYTGAHDRTMLGESRTRRSRGKDFRGT